MGYENTSGTIDQMLELRINLESRNKLNTKRLSELDTELSGIAHVVEANTFSLYESYLIINKVKALRNERRIVKRMLFEFTVFNQHKKHLPNSPITIINHFVKSRTNCQRNLPTAAHWKNEKVKLLKLIMEEKDENVSSL